MNIERKASYTYLIVGILLIAGFFPAISGEAKGEDKTIVELINEGFEGYNFTSEWNPPGWSNTGWLYDIYGGPHGGLHWAYSWAAGDVLTTPVLNFGENTELSFWYATEIANPFILEVYVDSTQVWAETHSDITYQQAIIDLSTFTGNHQISFVGQTSALYGQTLDDIIVTSDVDITPPTITNVDAQPPVQTVGQTVTITCDVTDDEGVGNVYANVTFPDTTKQSYLMSGAGSYSYAQIYSQAGVHTYHIYATDINGNSIESSSYTFDMNNPPIADFDYTPISPTTQDIVQFTDASTDSDGAIVGYYWDFNDGATSTDQNPTHQFDDGTYTVTLTVTDDDGATDDYSETVTVLNILPIADFAFSPSNPSTADTVQFTDASTDPDGTVVSWDWDFGDGGTSTLKNPSYSFSDDGTFTVILTVTDDDGGTDIYSDTITVTNVGPTAAFSYTPADPTTQDIVQFTDASTDSDGIIASWEWQFGDGATSTLENPTHQYDNGFYDITLTVWDDDGASDTIADTIEVSNAPPTAAFSYLPADPTTQDIVQFTDESTDFDGTVVSWDWDFGDGATSTLKNPTHQFNDGTYIVTLTVTDDDSTTDYHSETVIVLNILPVADFTFSPSNPTTADTVQFTDASTDQDGTIESWNWDFGDGATSTLENPTHQFDDGTYTVTLTVTDDDGGIDSFFDIVTVANLEPTADFTFTPINPSTADTVQFTDQSSDPDGTIASWDWDFDDGATSTLENPTHSYSDDGTYTVTLTVTDDDGATDVHTDTITVSNVAPTADYTYFPIEPSILDTVDFTDASTDSDGTIASWYWDFDDGTTSTDQNPSHQFTVADQYTVSLTVTDDDGATDTTDITIDVSPPVEVEDVNQSVQDRGFPIRHAADGDWAGAQSFKTNTVTTLTSAQIYLRKFGTPEFNLTVEIREDGPEGPLIDSLEYPVGDIPSVWEWFKIDFTNFTADPSTTYFIVLPPAPSGVTTSFGYEWGYAFGNQYDDGSFWFTRDGGGLWRDLPTMYEMTFSTYGFVVN